MRAKLLLSPPVGIIVSLIAIAGLLVIWPLDRSASVTRVSSSPE
jgi:hypothetical protein